MKRIQFFMYGMLTIIRSYSVDPIVVHTNAYLNDDLAVVEQKLQFE